MFCLLGDLAKVEPAVKEARLKLNAQYCIINKSTPLNVNGCASCTRNAGSGGGVRYGSPSILLQVTQ